MRYIITSFGYDGGPEFTTLTEARKELQIWKQQDMEACKRSFRMAKLSCPSPDTYKVTFGANIYSAASIHKI